jgi:purine-binding chemotaxis protein CheW
MRKRLGLPDRPADKLPMNVVVRGTDGAVSLLVDQIGDVIEVSEDHFEPPPETLQGPARELVQGTYKLDKKLLMLLNCEVSVQV